MNENIKKLVKNIGPNRGVAAKLLLENEIVTKEKLIEGAINIHNPEYLLDIIEYIDNDPSLVNKIGQEINNIKNPKYIYIFLKKYSKILTENNKSILEKTLLEINQKEYIYDTLKDVKNINNNKLIDKIISTNNYKYAYLILKDFKNIDELHINNLVNTIINSKNPEYIYLTALIIDKEDIKKMLLLSINETRDREYICYFARDVSIKDKSILEDTIISINDPEYIWYYLSSVKEANIDRLINALISIKDPEYIFRVAKYMPQKSLDVLEDTIIDISNPEYIIKFVCEVPNSDIEKLIKSYLNIVDIENIDSRISNIINQNKNLNLKINKPKRISFDRIKINYFTTMEHDKYFRKNRKKLRQIFLESTNDEINNNIKKLVMHISKDHGNAARTLIKNGIVSKHYIESVAILLNNPKYLLDVSKYIENINLEKISKALIQTKHPKYIYEFIEYNQEYIPKNIINKLVNAIVDINNLEYIYLTLKNISNIDKTKLETRIIESKNKEFIYLVAKEITNININLFVNAIIDLNNSDYMYKFLKDIKLDYDNMSKLIDRIILIDDPKFLYLTLLIIDKKIKQLDDLLTNNGYLDTNSMNNITLLHNIIKKLELKLDATNNLEYIFLSLKNRKSCLNKKELLKTILNSKDPKYIYLTAKYIEDDPLFEKAIIETKNIQYMNKFLEEISPCNRTLKNTIIDISNYKELNIDLKNECKTDKQNIYRLLELKYFLIMECNKEINKNKEIYKEIINNEHKLYKREK